MINNLTNDMMRLCDEIGALRESRAALMTGLTLRTANLKNSVAQMVTDFRNDRAEKAEKTKAELGEFMSSVKDAVANLRQNIADLRTEFVSDLSGARKVWAGCAAGRTSYRMATEEPAQETTSKAKKKKRHE